MQCFVMVSPTTHLENQFPLPEGGRCEQGQELLPRGLLCPRRAAVSGPRSEPGTSACSHRVPVVLWALRSRPGAAQCTAPRQL